ncbi:MAG: SPOR domain-containing protein [Sphingobium sp.]
MKSLSGLSVAVSILALGALPACPAAAQSGAIVQQTPPSLAVERLNQNLNRLSRQPTDMEALIGAGMASYELGDEQAANGFFTRANMVNARDGRAKLGLALVSLDLKQPRDAAAYFDDAEALGVRADKYMAERAMAYDLTGQQDKAQRDYAIALQRDPGNMQLTRAYAVSLGISGKVDLAEAQLRPLLFKSDRAAWRDRTMILAMNGRTAEARRIAQTIMPRNLSDAMEPYLIRMGSLTPAQKAAAVHYGQFPADGLRLATVTTPPAAAQVTARAESAARRTSSRDRRKGAVAAQSTAPTDDSSLLAAMPRGDAPPAMVQSIPAPVAAAPIAPALASRAATTGDDDPDGWTTAERQRVERRGQSARAAQPTRTVEASNALPTSTRTVQPVPQPAAPVQSMQPIAPTSSQPPVRMAMATPSAQPQPSPVQGPTPTGNAVSSGFAPIQPAAQRPAPAPAAPVVAVPTAVPAPTPAAVPAQAPVAPVPVPAAPQPGFTTAPVEGAAPAARPRTLAEIMAGIEVPESERVAPPQLVDLNEVAQIQATKRKAAAEKAKREAAAKLKAEADAKAKAEAEEKARLKANPARIWVQIATGRDPAALAFDMRRLRKTYSVLAGEDAFTAEWGATRRLLVGPFVTQAKAKAMLTDLKKAGSDGFVWQSEAGETVAPLSGK